MRKPLFPLKQINTELCTFPMLVSSSERSPVCEALIPTRQRRADDML